MGFNSVYRVLQEVFPEVDTRLLRAVAIEHSKDADTAVEVVLVEIIPFLSNGTTASGSSNDEAVEDAYLPDRSEDTPQVVSRCLDGTVGSLNGASRYDVNDGHDHFSGNDGNAESIPMVKHDESNLEVVSDVTSHVTLIDLVHENSRDDDCIHINTKNEEINSLQESSNDKVGSDQGSHVLSTTSMHDFGCSNGVLSANQLVDWEDFGGSSACDDNMVMQGESHHEHNHSGRNHLELAKEDSLVQLAPSLNQDSTQDAPEGDLQFSVVCPLNSLHEKLESSDSSDAASKKDISVGEMVEMEDESTLNTVVTRSGQICRIDLLEDIIEDARSNKKTLFSAMESVISLMREVELQEKAAEQAKEEAVRGGFDILARVEDLKQMLPHAMEANNMHSGEVYGEKAILATEVRELQSRVLCLLDERDKSLAILDEMRQTLEERLDAAEKERKAAEQEKMEREESARNAFAEQGHIMEKLVQESEMLKQEAEENSKLREFLMDRGRVVDMLQGEISVICQDVKLLKEKFDERVPLSKSLSSSQTTCILASSSSSLKSMSPDLVPEQDESSETLKKTSPSPSDNDQVSTGEERERDDQKALMDDGWEFFDNREFYM